MLINSEHPSVWTVLKNTKEPIIVFGTGNGADKVFKEFSKRGISVSGVAASDGFVRNREFHEFKVEPISYFEKTLKEFTVAVAFGSSRSEVMENIKALSRRHTVLVPCVPVVGEGAVDEEFMLRFEKDIIEARECLADDFSKNVFDGYINFQYSGRLEYIFNVETPEEELFSSCISLTENEVYVDIGAYRGDTVEKFLKYTGNKYKRIIAAEPDVKSYNKLLQNCGSLENFTAENVAVTNVNGTVLFSQSAGRQSAVGSGTPQKAVTLSSLCENNVPTYVKIDAEGEEVNILTAAKELLAVAAPKLNIAAYHTPTDIFTLPLIIKQINPDYKIHLRHHPYIPAWDTEVIARLSSY